jgi:KUP system potassium uptake protein
MHKNQKATAAGLLIALGIIYGDIGTSPLYVLNAIIKDKVITGELILGALSCVIWTLTLQTTFKYVILTLRADNKGEGGIFSLFALVRRRRKWLVFPAMIGGASLLADGMITPPISVTSAIEGLRNIPALAAITNVEIVAIVLSIIFLLFFVQQFGTASIGKFFGPIMTIWFVMLAALGLSHLHEQLKIFKAFNPYYAINLLVNYPKGFWLLGAVFLCTTGAEALYSDLGHCGKSNIRVSWIMVKTCLLLNYLGQGAWLLSHYKNVKITDQIIENGFNPFYGIMPQWFVIPGIVIATTAAIIASQALISGSFTLISEAIRLNLWPKMRIKYPTEAKGQLYVPGINSLLLAGCSLIVLYFQKATNMEAAYGLAITMCMIATTILLANFFVLHRTQPAWIYVFLVVYFTIEGSFLIANLDKFPHGGFVTLLAGGALFVVMYVWYRARRIKNRYIEYVKLENYIGEIGELSRDKSIPKYATHLVYLTAADNYREIEHKILYSILNRKPKRADIYWLIHVRTLDDPYTSEYSVQHIVPNDIIRVEFRLGFRIPPRLNLMFRKVLEDLVARSEVNITSRYESLQKNNRVGDFQFIVMEKYLSQDNELPFTERVIMKLHFWLRKISLSEERGFGLDASYVLIEKFPLIVSPSTGLKLVRIDDDE